MPVPTIPAANSQAVQTVQAGGTIPFVNPWWAWFNAFANYVNGLPTSGGLQTIPVLQWYVSATGNDANNGQSPATAFLTINHALSVIYSYWWNNQQVQLNIGAGTFAPFTVYGPSPSSGPNNAIRLAIVGNGVGSTIINAGTLVRNSNVSVAGITFNCTAANAGISIDAEGVVVVAGAIGFAGNSASANCWSVNQFGSVIHNSGQITVSGTCGIYFFGFNTANYESNSSTGIVITASIVSLATVDINSNMHFYGSGTPVSFSGGTASGNAYLCEGNSFLESWGTLDATWVAAGGQAGSLQSGGRTISSATAPSIVSSTGLGTGNATIAGGGSAYGIDIQLNPAGAPSTSGNVVVQINEFLTGPSGAAPYVLGARDGSGSWTPGFSMRIVNVAASSGNRQYTIVWTNNGVALTAGSNYHINMIGQN